MSCCSCSCISALTCWSSCSCACSRTLSSLSLRFSSLKVSISFSESSLWSSLLCSATLTRQIQTDQIKRRISLLNPKRGVKGAAIFTSKLLKYQVILCIKHQRKLEKNSCKYKISNFSYFLSLSSLSKSSISFVFIASKLSDDEKHITISYSLYFKCLNILESDFTCHLLCRVLQSLLQSFIHLDKFLFFILKQSHCLREKVKHHHDDIKYLFNKTVLIILSL